jgi:Tfp pilus assembly protein PilF
VDDSRCGWESCDQRKAAFFNKKNSMMGCVRIWLLLAIGSAFGETALERGIEAFARRDFITAEREFLQAVRDQSANARAHKFLGMVYTAQERFQLAEVPFRRACTIDPREENACYYLGRLYHTLSRFEDSLNAFNRALNSRKEKARIFYGRAFAQEALGRYEEAESDFKEAIRAGDKTALKDYGMFLFRRDRPEESIKILRKAGAKEDLGRVTKALANAPGSRAGRDPQPVRFENRPLDMIVNNGATGRKYLVETMIAGIAVFDYDNDGWPDVFIANGGSLPGLEKTDSAFHNRLFHNNKDGTFTDVTAKAALAGAGYSMGAASADYDNDGWEDLFVTGVRSNALYRNRGDGTFEDVTLRAGVAGDGSWSVAAAWLDYNNDGFKDVFTANGNVMDNAETLTSRQSRQPNTVFLNRGDGTFRTQILPGAAFHRGAAFGDLDRDGRMDVVVSRLNEKPIILRNETGASGHWIQLRLVGKESNRDGIGAWIHIVTESGEQWNRITTAVGYGCSSEKIAHFGLGKDSLVKTIEINWPSGIKQRLSNIRADGLLTIEEK